ncbi:MAG: sugar ABC transporter permease [Herpetosiphonaceae bacterium]|nr:sugar ABC transporter permease [Herpetosiphonaceae bacterium]
MVQQTETMARTHVPVVKARQRRVQEIALGYAMLAPALLLLVVFEFYPIFYGLYISLCNWRLGCNSFVGAANFTRALHDPEMWHSLWITTVYALLSVPLQLGLGLFLAYLLFQKIRYKPFFRTVFFLPYVTSSVASAAVWSYLYSPDRGPLNALLGALGFQPRNWLGEPLGIFTLIAQSLGLTLPSWAGGPSLALVSIVIYTTWVFVGYAITIFLAGLGTIPPELYDAAKVDGASGWVQFRYVTLPLLSPTTFFLLIFTVIGTFKAFNHIYVMTQGGPYNETTTASIFIFRQLFESNRYGYSAALSFILFFCILLLTIFQNRVVGRRVNYD